jgi:small GTP-binding protein
MIQKKVCMLGAFAVGKTSLVARFVESIFSDKYHTTVGVKIDKKMIQLGEQEVTLILWDIHGEDELQKIRLSYLRGSSGYLLVVDGTRRITLDQALLLQQNVAEATGNVPFVLVLNKADLVDEWDIDDDIVKELSDRGWVVIKASAKTGEGVEEAFLTLARQMVEA